MLSSTPVTYLIEKKVTGENSNIQTELRAGTELRILAALNCELAQQEQIIKSVDDSYGMYLRFIREVSKVVKSIQTQLSV